MFIVHSGSHVFYLYRTMNECCLGHCRGGYRILRRRGHQPSRGRQHTNLPDFPKNCMKLRNFWSAGRDACWRHSPLDPPLHWWFEGKPRICTAPTLPPPSPISFIFMQFLAKIIPSNRFSTQRQGLAPPSGKSWIRNCLAEVNLYPAITN